MIITAQTNMQELIVVFIPCFTSRQFHTNVVPGEAMHSLTSRRLLKEHLCLLSDITGIKCLRLLVRKVKQTLAALFLSGLIDHVGDVQRGGSRTF